MYFQKYSIGDVIAVPKMQIIDHVGLIVGFNKVAHASPKNGLAIISTIAEFCGGQEPRYVRSVKNTGASVKKALELVVRGYKYNLSSANCEHFVSECENGKPESPQLLKWFVVGIFTLAASVLLVHKE